MLAWIDQEAHRASNSENGKIIGIINSAASGTDD